MKFLYPIPSWTYDYSSFQKKAIQYSNPLSCAIISATLKDKDVFFTGDNHLNTDDEQRARSRKSSFNFLSAREMLKQTFSRSRSRSGSSPTRSQKRLERQQQALDDFCGSAAHNQHTDARKNFLSSLYSKPLQYEADGLASTVETISKSLSAQQKIEFKQSIEDLFEQKKWSKNDGILEAITKPL